MCPRCSGRMFQYELDDRACASCGYVQYGENNNYSPQSLENHRLDFLASNSLQQLLNYTSIM